MSCLFHEEVKEKIPSVYEKIFQILDVMPVTDRGENIDAPQILLAWEPEKRKWNTINYTESIQHYAHFDSEHETFV